MSVMTRAQLQALADLIGGATERRSNTPQRVGDCFRGLADSVALGAADGDVPVGTFYNVQDYGAIIGGPAAGNVTGIRAAISAADNNGSGVVMFPGGSAERYDIDDRIAITSSNIKLWAPGGAKLRVASAIPVVLSVGDIETGANLTQGNTLASNAAAGDQTVTLAAGKGANVAAGSWVVVRSAAVVPEHDAAVVNKVAEFANVYSIAGDVLTLAAPLRYPYLTADTAQVYVIDWIENFAMIGLGVDGNAQTASTIGLQMSWCKNALVHDAEAVDLQQRWVRFQGCLGHRAVDVRQINALSNGYNGDSGHFGYTVAEQGLCARGRIIRPYADRTRHGYTTGAGWTTNVGITSVVLSGIGVPMDTYIGQGFSSNAKGAGFDTHEVGTDIVFDDCEVLGGLQVGFQTRSVRTRYRNCRARDLVGAALQIGSDAQDTIIESLDWQNTNLGTDQEGSTDWTKQSPIVDNSARSYLGKANPNELDNGNFDFWDRGTSFTATGATANRWQMTIGAGATITLSRQSHSSVAGPESGRYYLRFNRTVAGAAASTLQQFCEAIRETAGQRVVLSFDARASVDGTDLEVFLRQYFGTTGSPSASVDTTAVTRRLTTSWVRYHAVVDLASVLGKTFGSDENPALVSFFSLPTAAGAVFVDLDRVKLEVSRTPTDFVPLSYAVEAERVRRWYEKSYLDGVSPATATSVGAVSVIAPIASTAHARMWVPFATRKGRVPTVKVYATVGGTIDKVYNTSTATALDGAVTDSSGAQLTGFYGGANGGAVNVSDLIKFQWTAGVTDFE